MSSGSALSRLKFCARCRRCCCPAAGAEQVWKRPTQLGARALEFPRHSDVQHLAPGDDVKPNNRSPQVTLSDPRTPIARSAVTCIHVAYGTCR